MLSVNSPTSALPALKISYWSYWTHTHADSDMRTGHDSSFNYRLSDDSRVETPQAVGEDKYLSVNTCATSIDVWQRYVDCMCQAGEMLNNFHVKINSRMLGVYWQNRVSNAVVLFRACLPSMYHVHGKFVTQRQSQRFHQDSPQRILHVHFFQTFHLTSLLPSA